MSVVELLGYSGHALLAICSVPAAVQTLYRKKCYIPWTLLVPWGLGEALALSHAVMVGFEEAYANYIINTVAVGIMAYYRAQTRPGRVMKLTKGK